MEYRYTPNENYEDFAAGRVIYHMGGEPTFPVRLALELYERCLSYSNKKTDITLYDCCCGGAYMLTILGLLKGNSISRIYGSDIDEKSLRLATDNLGLLTEQGLKRRREEIKSLYESYGKFSHKEALQSVDRFEKLRSKELCFEVFYRNALEEGKLPFVPDIILTDVPYGNMVEWDEGCGGINGMMDALYQSCARDTILCVCMDKKQKISSERFQRLERQQIGKRRFEIFRMI
jgi:23S rRNA (guanine2535-N1)-methyltransferase